MSKRMDEVVRKAVAAGLLASSTSPSLGDERHWAVLVFTALAAWLSAIPLTLMIFFIADSSAVTITTCGVLMLVISVLILRNRRTPLFFEQLAIPGLLAGMGLFAFGTAEKFHSSRTGFNMGLLCVCLTIVMVRQAWVRTLLGAALGALGVASLLPEWSDWFRPIPVHLSWLAIACTWLLLHMGQRTLVLEGATARWIAGFEAVSAGLGATALSGLIWASGSTFLLDESFGASLDDAYNAVDIGMVRGLSVALTIAGGSWLAYRWPMLRAWWAVTLLGLFALVAWFAPLLGVCLAMLSVCVESRRYVLAAYAAVGAVWMVGGLYYATTWPLATKAQLLVGVGLALTLLGRYTIAVPLAEPDLMPEAMPPLLRKRRGAGVLVCGLLVVGAVNAAIWHKESVISTGTAVYVELAPVDPRSLMQGDYMRLSFRLPEQAFRSFVPPSAAAQAVARLDKSGVAQLLRIHDGSALAAGEFTIDLVPRHGQWTLVTDTWYFKEGEAERWANARYGEFRVSSNGKALLVGLRGPKLEKL
jgi:uncharacterized membrane-anchored protein